MIIPKTKTGSLIGWIVSEFPIVAKNAGKDLQELSKEEKTADKLANLIFAHFAFYMESTHGMPHDITYEFIRKNTE